MTSIPLRTSEPYPETADYSTLPSTEQRAALAYARRGKPVFPLKPGGKTPITRHGFKDATTDEDQVRDWWTLYPTANIGLPTGKVSGLLVLDVDDYASLEALEREHGKLPATASTRTGSGGRHIVFTYPTDREVRNSAGSKLGYGLDVRGEGGYIVAPGSVTTSPYEWLNDLPVVHAPEWLLEKLTETHSAPTGDVRTSIASPITTAGEMIPEGVRNWTLYREGCRVRARGCDRDAVHEHLVMVNASRCSPPMEPAELEQITTSAARHAPGSASPEVTPEVLEVLEGIRRSWWAHEWKGGGGHSDRDVEHALLLLAGQHGEMIPAGVRVSVDYRTVALMAGVGSTGTVSRAVQRLKEAGRLRADNAERKQGEAGAFVLVPPPRIVEHSTIVVPHTGEPLDAVPPCAPPTAPRLRRSKPVFSRVGNELIRETLHRAGKIAGAMVDHLERTGDWTTWKDLAAMMRKKRHRDLRSRQGKDLAEASVVECSGDYVRLSADWLDALNRMREEGGEIADHRRDMAEYERQRDAYRNRHRHKPDSAPTHEQMREHRENAHERRRDAIETTMVRLFREHPEYRTRRVGQITCAIIARGLPDDFPRGIGPGGAPKDHEVAEILKGNGLDVAA